METIETDVEPMSSPFILPSINRKKHQYVSHRSHYLYFSLIIAFAIGTDQSMTLGTGFIRHGGVVFFMQFGVSLLIVGLPLFLLETAMAQFSSKGPFLQFRQASPLFGGLSSAMSFLLALRIVLLAVSLSDLGSFAVSSIKEPSKLPWGDCSSLPRDCFDPRLATFCNKNITEDRPECVRQASALVLSRTTNERKTPFWSFAESAVHDHSQVVAEFNGPRLLSWICLLFVWLLVAVISIRLDKWLDYVAPAVCLLSFLYYAMHLVIAMSLGDVFDGLSYAWKPRWKALYSPEAWTNAVAHAVFVFNLGNGGAAQISSRRPFSSHLRRDVALVTGCILVFYIFHHLATFAYAGYLANLTYSDHPAAHRMKHLLERRLHFLQFVYVEIMAGISLNWLWSTLHFILEFLRGFFLLTLMFWVLLEMFRDRRNLSPNLFEGGYKWKTVTFLLCGGVFASTAFIAAGIRQHQLVEHFANVLTLVVAFVEAVLFAFVYGVKRLAVNLGTMSPWWRLSMNFYSLCWGFLTPTALLTCVLMYIIAAIVKPQPLPGILSFVGWVIVIVGISFPVVYGCMKLWEKRRNNWKKLKTPTSEWGPLLDEDRRLATQRERADRVR